MADFGIPEATTTLALTGPYHGVEYTVRATLSPRVYFGIRTWVAQLDDAADVDQTMEATRGVAELFAAHGLVSWNIAGVPCTLDGLLTLDWSLITELASTWIASIGQVALPLSEASVAPRQSGSKRRSTVSSSTRAGSPKKLTGPTSAASSAS